jgi:hypothetical protein
MYQGITLVPETRFPALKISLKISNVSDTIYFMPAVSHTDVLPCQWYLRQY